MKADQLVRTIEIKDARGRVVGTKEVVTYQGLLSKAHDEGLKRIATRLLQTPNDDNGRTAIAKAAVETGKGLFEALGDANPGNVNSYIVPHLIRMAETRAKARALRDAVNVGSLSAEELLGEDTPFGEAEASRPPGDSAQANGQDAAIGASRASAAEFVPMTDSQRRYMFRLLTAQGHQGVAAEDVLKTRFAIKSLDTVSKADAIGIIARLLDESGSPAER